MSILIKNMEMPNDITGTFRGCKIVTGKKYAMNDPVYASSSTRPEWCPLVEILPHGDLIDRKALMQSLGITNMECDKCGWCDDRWGRCMRGSDFEDSCCAIEDAPTIIEAEEGET